MADALRRSQAESGMSALFVERLNGVRQRLNTQLKGLESGQVKVLHLLDGGSTDEDNTREHVEQLQRCIRDIDLILQVSEHTEPARHEPTCSPYRTAVDPTAQLAAPMR